MPHTPPPSSSIVAFSQVHTAAKSGEPALHDVSFALGRGEILTLLGAHASQGGNGVASVLALLAGFSRATQGHVLICGHLANATATHQRAIGMVSRRLALFSHLDVRGHANFAPGVTPAQADAILQRLELTPFAHRRADRLPPELQYRVALARALARAPSLLLLEDPMGGWHGGAGAGLKSILRALAAETGVSILHASDDVTTSYGLSDRIGILQSGRLRQIGAPQALYDRPDCFAVAQAMGALNTLPGTVLSTEDDIARIRLSCGAIVEARMVKMLFPHAACLVVIRPERIAISTLDPSMIGDGAVPVRLLHTLFAGDQIRLQFGMTPASDPLSTLLVTRPSGAALPRETTMCLAWQSHHAIAFPTEAA